MNESLILLVKQAISEDMPKGDITTDSLDLGQKRGRARLIAKEDLVLSGSEVFSLTFKTINDRVDLLWQFRDGDFIFKHQTVCVATGELQALLKAERVALNFLGRLSGIASLTRCFVNAVKESDTIILDTRKTTPGLRALEKKAVVHGGGQNHRMNLSDAILIKENHIQAAGGLKAAVQAVKKLKRPIEVEVKNLDEVREVLNYGVDHIMFDNMSDLDMKEALKLIPSTIKTEASGNMRLDRVSSVAQLGVNFISVGAITHSAPSADFSLIFEDIV